MSKNIKDTNKKHHMYPKLIGVAVALVACLIGGTVVVGKYVKSEDNSGEVKAKEFYFTSDLLKEKSENKSYNLPAGTDKINFTVGNYADELRKSDVDVMYKFVITATDKAGAEVDSNASAASNNDKYVISASGKSDDTITLSNLKNGLKYTVTATGYSAGDKDNPAGYVKTLQATFEVAEAKLYKHLEVEDKANTGNNGCYVLLTVWSEGYQGNDIKIDFNNSICTLIPDNTDSVMSSAKTSELTKPVDSDDIGKFTDATSFKDNEYSSHTYRFFVGKVEYGKSYKDLNAEDFSVTGSYTDDDSNKTTTITATNSEIPYQVTTENTDATENSSGSSTDSTNDDSSNSSTVNGQ